MTLLFPWPSADDPGPVIVPKSKPHGFCIIVRWRWPRAGSRAVAPRLYWVNVNGCIKHCLIKHLHWHIAKQAACLFITAPWVEVVVRHMIFNTCHSSIHRVLHAGSIILTFSLLASQGWVVCPGKNVPRNTFFRVNAEDEVSKKFGGKKTPSIFTLYEHYMIA